MNLKLRCSQHFTLNMLTTKNVYSKELGAESALARKEVNRLQSRKWYRQLNISSTYCSVPVFGSSALQGSFKPTFEGHWHQSGWPFHGSHGCTLQTEQSLHLYTPMLRLLSFQTQWNLKNTFTKSTAPYFTISKIFKSQHSTEITRCWHLPFIYLYMYIYL